MTEAVGSVTREVGAAMLDLLLMRHRVIANNIANEASQGFRPLQLTFEQYLEPLRGALDTGDAGQVRAVLTQMQAGASAAPSGEDSVRLDNEMTALSKNTLQYQALLAAIEKLSALERLGITGE